MVKIEIDPINVSTNTSLQNYLTKKKVACSNRLIKTIVHVSECVLQSTLWIKVCLQRNGEVSLFFTKSWLRAYLIIRLDKEFTNELVDRANLKAKVPQMFGTNL